jgi:hypothetical protein
VLSCFLNHVFCSLLPTAQFAPDKAREQLHAYLRKKNVLFVFDDCGRLMQVCEKLLSVADFALNLFTIVRACLHFDE